MYKVLQLVCIMCILYSYFILYYTYMAKRINVYLTDDDISILWDMWWKEIVELAKKGLSGTVERISLLQERTACERLTVMQLFLYKITPVQK